MPGARPAEQEVEASEESESEPEPEKKAREKGPSGKDIEAKDTKKAEDESLDDLLDDLNK